MVFKFVYDSESAGKERQERFKELMLNISAGLLGSTSDTGIAVKELAYQIARYVDFEKISDAEFIVREVLGSVMDAHGELFSNERETYMRLALDEVKAYSEE